MMVRLGNFLFRYRNGLFPLVYLLLLVPSRSVFADPRVAAMLGLLVAAMGQGLRAVTVGWEYIIRGGRKRQVYASQLVQGGMYAYCRNPLYVGNGLILLGVGLAANSWLFLGVALPFFTIAYAAIVAAEESYLLGKFGAEYADYCRRVPRFLPSLPVPAQQLERVQFNWRRLVTAEYGSAYIWIAAWLLVTLRNLAWADGSRNDRSLVAVLVGCLVVATLAYLVAWGLKKTGLLTAARRPAA